MLVNRPAYQGEELETQWVKMPLRSWLPQEPEQWAKLYQSDLFACGLCRVYEGQCRPGVSVRRLTELE